MTPEHFWPWWAAITFFLSGGVVAFVLTITFWRSRVTCPDCDYSIRADRFRDPWKECLS